MFTSTFPKLDHQAILDNFKIIRDDYRNIKLDQYFDYPHADAGIDDLIQCPTNTGYFWQVYPLTYLYKPWDGRKSQTIDLLMNLKVRPLLSTFSILHPYSKIDTHQDHDESAVNDNTTTVIKYHLTLDTVPGTGLVVGNEDRPLQNGDLNIFDESTDHWAYNNSNKIRGVLIISFLRKDLE
jgi:aspartyl/asparaginyl beta-hydroxylase (cupin superfamily)